MQNPTFDSGNQSVDLPDLPPVPEYVPSGKVGLAAWPIFALAIPITGVLGGYVFFFASKSLYTGFFAPLFSGLLIAWSLMLAVFLGKCRNPYLAATAGVLAAIISYGAFFGFYAASLRAEYIAVYTRSLDADGKIPPAQVRSHVEQWLSPARYFRIFMEDRAKLGVTFYGLGNTSGAKPGKPWTGKWYWMLLAIDIAVTLYFTADRPASAAMSRFSEEHNRWFPKETHSFDPAAVPELLRLALKGDWNAAGALCKAHKVDWEIAATVEIYYLPPDAAGTVLITHRPGNRRRTLYEGLLSDEEIRQLRGLA